MAAAPIPGAAAIVETRWRLELWRDLVLRRLRRRAAPVAPVRHELIELGLVLGGAQAVEEIAELLLLVLEAPQRLGPIVVEGVVAARGAPAPGAAEAPHRIPHAIHLVLPVRTRAFAPKDVGQ